MVFLHCFCLSPPFAAATDPRFSSFDAVFEGIVQDLEVPGISVAAARDGNVVFASGYGFADKEHNELVRPDSLFRIASISKPITAVAILQLVERGKLDLETPVFELLDYDEEIAAVGDSFDQRLLRITIRQLLQHRGGWDRDKSFDPMFRSVKFAKEFDELAPAPPETIIQAMLRRRLDFDPGTKYAYSNFGYCLLGRVIEAITKLDYEAYVQREVLRPLGIDGMRIGRTRLAQRAENEVRYYHSQERPSVFAEDLGESVPAPYGAWYLEAMDSHGGWLATATDLAKFGMAFDNPDHCPILSPESIAFMHARPKPLDTGAEEDESEQDERYYYSCGWSNRIIGKEKVNRWHTGSLPGTATILIRRHDGLTLVALVNSREGAEGKGVAQAIDRALQRAANGVVHWQ